MKKLLIILIAIIGILFAGKFGLEYRYKQKLDELIKQTSAFVDISYDKLFIDYKGGLNVEKLKLQDRAGKIKANVEKLRLYSSDRTLLLTGLDSLDDGNFPELLEANIDNLLLDNSKKYQANNPRECRDILVPSKVQVSSTATSPANISLRLESHSSDTLKLKIFSTIENTSRTSVEALFDKSVASSPLNSSSNNRIPFKTIQYTNSFDKQHANAIINYCSALLNMGTEDYIANILNNDEYYSSLELFPTSELKGAFIRYFTGENTMSISAKPSSSSIKLSQLKLFKPQQIINSLNIVVKENDTVIPELINSQAHTNLVKQAQESSSDTATNQENNTTSNLNTDQDKNTSTTTTEPTQTKKKFTGKRRFNFQQIQKSDAKKYIGKSAKIYRKKRLIKGEILSANSQSIQINSNQFGGSTLMTLPLNEINKIEVKIFKPIQ